MSDLNIDDFRRDTAIALLRLYNNFPTPHTLYIQDICGDENEDEFGLISKRHEACLATINWLANEGFIHYKTLLETEAVEQAVLTLLGIELLLGSSTNATGVSRIESLRKGLASRSSTSLEQAINELLHATVSRKH